MGENTGLIDRGNEWSRAAVHDRDFRTVDFDRGVVDAHAPQRGEYVFRGGDQRALSVAQNGCEFSGDHGLRRGLDLAVATVQTSADKNEAGIDGCRSEDQTNGKARMNADARNGGLRAQRCLPAKFHLEIAPPTHPKTESDVWHADSPLSSPRSRRRIPLPQSAPYSRFFTNCYPI